MKTKLILLLCMVAAFVSTSKAIQIKSTDYVDSRGGRLPSDIESYGKSDIQEYYGTHDFAISPYMKLTFDGNDLFVEMINLFATNTMFFGGHANALIENGNLSFTFDLESISYDCHDIDAWDRRFSFDDFPPGEYDIEFYGATRKVRFESGKPAFYVLSMFDEESLHVVREGIEWVYYNPLSKEISRMRFHGRTFVDVGEEHKKAMLKLYRYHTHDFNPETAYPICYMREGVIDGETAPKHTAHGVEAHFIKGEQYFAHLPLAMWINFDYIFMTAYASPEYSQDIRILTYDFNIEEPMFSTNAIDGNLEELVVSETRNREIDGHNVKEIFFTNGGHWIEGIGAVGQDYSSNLPFPIYGGLMSYNAYTPTYLMYVRDLSDNHVLYGDPSLDPDYSLTASAAPAMADAYKCLAITENSATATGDGIVEISAFSTTGIPLAKSAGRGCASISLAELPEGIIIIRASTDSGSESRVVRIR